MIVSRWNRSQARIAWACALRNCAQVGPARRGVGSIPAAFRIFQTVEAPIWWPRLASSPWIRLDFIRRGRAAGLTLTQIREVLHIRDAGQTPCKHVRELLADRLAGLDAQIVGLQDLRASVSQLYNVVATADPDTSDTGQVCRYL